MEKDDHTQSPRVSSFVQNPQILQLQTSATKQSNKYTHLEHSDFCTIFGQDDDFSPFCDLKSVKS